MLALALKERWFRDKLRGWGWVIRNAGTVRRRRRSTQQLRRIRDRDLARYLTATFFTRDGPRPRAPAGRESARARYWRLVSRAL